MLGWLERLFNYRTEHTDPMLAHTIGLVNRLVLIGLVFGTCYSALYTFGFRFWQMGLVNQLFILGFLSYFWLIKQHRYRLATATFATLFLAMIFVMVTFFASTRSGFQYYFVLAAPACFYVFGALSSRLQYSFVAISFLLFLLSHAIGDRYVKLQLSDAQFELLSYSSSIAVFVLLVLMVALFQRKIHIYQANLTSSAKRLSSSNTELQAEIEKRKRTQSLLNQNEQKFRALFESSRDAVLIVANSRLVDVNSAAQRLFAIADIDDVLNQPINVLTHKPTSAAEAEEEMSTSSLASITSQNIPPEGLVTEICIHRQDEYQFDAEVSVSRISIGEDNMLHLVVRDITQRRKMESKLYYLASTDTLTDIPNRHTIMEYGKTYLADAMRQKSPFSVLMIDLDWFKQINDQYGHAAGDKCLIEVAKCGKQVFRSNDIFGRSGGEEFIALLPDTGREPASEVAQRFRNAIKSLIVHIETNRVTLTVSIGIATSTCTHVTFEQLLSAADQAMYKAKQTGRDRVCID